MGEFAPSKGLFPSKESLARRLCKDLESYGIIYHVRTLKRQISGFIATVSCCPGRVVSSLSVAEVRLSPFQGHVITGR